MKTDIQKNKKQRIPGRSLRTLAQEWFQNWDIKVMSYVMLVVVMIAIIAATVAWFSYYSVAVVSGMHLVAAECETLKIEVKQGMEADGTGIHFVEVSEAEEDSVFADFTMPLFDNVETYEIEAVDTTQDEEAANGEASENGEASGNGDTSETVTNTVSKMAPGVYGSLTIRLTALNKEINRYQITPSTLFTYTDEVVANSNEDDILQRLAQGHILFFAERLDIPKDENGSLKDSISVDGQDISIENYTHNGKYVFSQPITAKTPLTGTLAWEDAKEEGTPEEVTVYWYWPYEYSNLSSEIKASIQLPGTEELHEDIYNETRRMYFDIDNNELIFE